jgi:hypothetical protein
MKCNLISDDNGVGLSVDVALLKGYLESRGHIATFVDWQAQTCPTADVNFFLEKFNEAHLKTAAAHVGIFNLEWLDMKVAKVAREVGMQIWAKSVYAHEWFTDRGHDVYYTGFLSRDMLSYGNLTGSWGGQHTAIHVAGKSQAKGTTVVMQAYWLAARLHINLPPLVLISYVPIEPLPPNVVQYNYRVADADLAKLMCRATYHLCPSEVEGWGHYITEALSVGGIVITTDASPMSDHVLPSFGCLIEPKRVVQDRLVNRVFIEPEQLIAMLIQLKERSADAIAAASVAARKRWRIRNEAFVTKADRLIEALQ